MLNTHDACFKKITASFINYASRNSLEGRNRGHYPRFVEVSIIDRVGQLLLNSSSGPPKNFNLINGAELMHEVSFQFPKIYDWASYCYVSYIPHFWPGDVMMRSVEGLQQGDPFGRLLFSITLQDVLTFFCKNISDRPQILTFYLDDGIIVAKHEALRKVLDLFDSQEVKSAVMYLGLSKCSICWPFEPDPNDRLAYPKDVQKHYGSETKILQKHIGDDSFFLDAMLLHMRSLEPLLFGIYELENIHVAIALLKNCVGACRMTYLLRVEPMRLVLKSERESENMVEGCLRNIFGGVLPH